MLRQDKHEPKTVLWTELMSATLEGDGCIKLIRLLSELIGCTLQRNKSLSYRERVWIVLAACMCVSRMYGIYSFRQTHDVTSYHGICVLLQLDGGYSCILL